MLLRFTSCFLLFAALAVSGVHGREPTTQPDLNAFPMNVAAVSATPFELKYPPQGEWESAEAMYRAYSVFQKGQIMGKPITRDEAGKEAFRRVADFAAAFVQRFPAHEYTFIMLGNRWRYLGEEDFGSIAPDLVEREIDGFFEAGGRLEPGEEELLLTLRVRIAANRAVRAVAAGEAPPDYANVLALAEKFAAAGRPEVAANGLESLAAILKTRGWPDEARQVKHRIPQAFPESEAAKRLNRSERLANAPGKPFELSFADVRTGERIDVRKDLKGKVLLIDFWATWCGPCVGDLPNVRALRDKYRDEGFEVISVSLDWSPERGGRQALLDFLGRNDMPWPQYYQGDGFESEFSREWGIRAIPTHFIVDAKGIIRSAGTHRVKESEALIAKLLDEHNDDADRE